MIISDEAIVLRNTDFRETSLITRAYSKEYGKISLLSKGIKSPKKNLISIIQPLSRISIEYYMKSNTSLYLLKEATTIQSNIKLRSKFNNILYGQCVIEIVDKATLASSADPILYRLLRRTLDKLSDLEISPIILFQFFQVQLIKRAGFMMALSRCHVCDSLFDTAYFDFVAGELCCMQCKKDTSSFMIDNRCLKYIRVLRDTNINDLGQYYNLNKNYTMKIINKFLDIYMTFHINGMQNLRVLNRIRLNE